MQILNIMASWHRIFPMRKRYFLTKNNLPRVRYIIALSILSAIAALIYSPHSDSLNTSSANIHDGTGVSISQALHDKFSDSLLIKQAASLTEPSFQPERILTIASGQTVAGLLQEEGISGNQAYYAVEAMRAHVDPRKVRPGQIIEVTLEQGEQGSGEEGIILKEMRMDIDPIKVMKVSYQGEDSYAPSIYERQVSVKVKSNQASIETSLYGSAARAGIPTPIIAEAIRVYSWDVDFQRDIRSGDTIDVMYETHETEDGKIAKYGDILYANLSVNSQPIEIYRYEMKNGDIDYFTEDGWSVRKALMKTPIDGARISSGYGLRKHPILGYNKLHKGVDFAAKTGTPIYAAGDGTLEEVGRKGGYGNYMRIRHNSTLKTAYAHLHKFAKGMGTGKRVKQGDVIGYVGSTGRSTGPHLHYEVLLNGKQVNPNRVDLPTGEKLKGEEYKSLQAMIKQRNLEFRKQLDSKDNTKGQSFASRILKSSAKSSESSAE